MIFRCLKKLWARLQRVLFLPQADIPAPSKPVQTVITETAKKDPPAKETPKRRRLTQDEIAQSEDLFERLSSLASYRKVLEGVRSPRIVVSGPFEQKAHEIVIEVSGTDSIYDEPSFDFGELSISIRHFDEIRMIIKHHLELAEREIELELEKLGFDPRSTTEGLPGRES